LLIYNLCDSNDHICGCCTASKYFS
jgi:hypothetical protein